MAGTGLASLVAQRLTRFPQLDPKAVLAVAAQEGLGGGIGDQGTSYGPFQLHKGGAYPSYAPQAPSSAQQWAWSPAGIDYALGNINKVAGGLKGQAAVTNIVSRFERPANIPNEVAGALRSYGAPVAGGSGIEQNLPAAPTMALSAVAPAVPAGPSPQQQAAANVSVFGRGLAQQLVESAQSLLGGGTPNLQKLFAQAKQFQQARQQLAKPALGGGSKLAASAGSKL